MADDVNVNFGANVGGALAGISAVTRGLRGIATPLEALAGIAGAAGGALVGAFTVNALFSFIEGMGRLGEETERLRIEFGDENFAKYYEPASKLIEDICLSDDYTDFLTTPAYELVG